MYKLKKYAFQNEIIALASFTVLASALALWSHFNQSKTTRRGQLDDPVDPLDSTTSALADGNLSAREEAKDFEPPVGKQKFNPEESFKQLEHFKTFLRNDGLNLITNFDVVNISVEIDYITLRYMLYGMHSEEFSIHKVKKDENLCVILESRDEHQIHFQSKNTREQDYVYQQFNNVLNCNRYQFMCDMLNTWCYKNGITILYENGTTQHIKPTFEIFTHKLTWDSGNSFEIKDFQDVRDTNMIVLLDATKNQLTLVFENDSKQGFLMTLENLFYINGP